MKRWPHLLHHLEIDPQWKDESDPHPLDFRTATRCCFDHSGAASGSASAALCTASKWQCWVLAHHTAPSSMPTRLPCLLRDDWFWISPLRLSPDSQSGSTKKCGKPLLALHDPCRSCWPPLSQESSSSSRSHDLRWRWCHHSTWTKMHCERTKPACLDTSVLAGVNRAWPIHTSGHHLVAGVAPKPTLTGHGSRRVEAKLLPGQVAHVFPHSALDSQDGRGRFVVYWSPDQSLKHREVHIVHPAKKQDGNHEPESLHVLRRWIDHNKMTVHYSAFFCDRKRRSQK